MNPMSYQPALAAPGAAAEVAVAASSSFEAVGVACSEEVVLESSCESAKLKLKYVK